MMKEVRQKLTLDRPATYRIIVPGELDASWSDWAGEMSISVEPTEDSPPVSILTVTIDQAALQGLLRRLYSLGLPLMSVICTDIGQADHSAVNSEGKCTRLS